ncbi:hypothetical protein FAEPRAM212_02164 [Faecalibacterium prausnitzii M21/2]|uniref:Uncharacterized protein n=1 Tax=Faecalibacterium prausnitzii M21/2 TaxID=411485 RepID=A8SDA5_9FIRM|nr:hypothetical protein FAEPRAM212_02164 [Faecalibacterium prausnitzii M21/2]
MFPGLNAHIVQNSVGHRRSPLRLEQCSPLRAAQPKSVCVCHAFIILLLLWKS